MNRQALILVDHGSVVDEANAMLEDLAAMLRPAMEAAVYPAHMELADPTVEQAFDAAVAEGADFVFIFPYFLSPGRHSRQDIPRLCREAAAKHPGVAWHCSGPIGLDETMATLIRLRMERCRSMQYQCEHCPDYTICQP